MAIGKTGSFANLQAPNDPLLDTLQNIEQVGFQKRAEDRLIAQKKKEEEDKELAEDVAWDGKFDPTIVGNSKIDDPMLSMAFKAKERVGKIRRDLKNPNLSYDEKVRLNSELNRISQSFDVANQTPKIILDKAKEIAKNIDKYDPDSVNLIEGIAKQLETGKYEAYYDENGTARVKIYNTDESGKPIGILKETTIADLANEFQPQLKSNFADILEKEVANTAVEETVVQNGFTTVTNKKVDEQVKNQRANAFGNLIANTPQEARHISKKFGIDINDKEAIAKKASEEFINALDVVYKKDIDQSGALASKKYSDEKEKEKSTIEVVETPPIFAEYKVEPMAGYKTVSIQGGKPIQQIVSVRNGKKVEYNSPFLNAYTVTKNPKTGGRAIAAVITYPDFKSSTMSAQEKTDILSMLKTANSKEEADLILSKATKPISYKTDVVYLTESDASKYLPIVGAKDVSEMADKARVGLPTYTRAELKGAGWSDAQINQAVKEGKLNVK